MRAFRHVVVPAVLLVVVALSAAEDVGAAPQGFLAELGGHLAACGAARNLAGCLEDRCLRVVREMAPRPRGRALLGGGDSLAEATADFLDGHELRIRLGGDVVSGVERNLAQGRKKKDKGLELLLLMGAMMKAALGAVALGGVAALAAKALVVGMMALTLAGAVGLKKLASGGGGEHKVELIAVHGHDDHHHGRSDDWRRLASAAAASRLQQQQEQQEELKGEGAHELAYGAYAEPSATSTNPES